MRNRYTAAFLSRTIDCWITAMKYLTERNDILKARWGFFGGGEGGCKEVEEH